MYAAYRHEFAGVDQDDSTVKSEKQPENMEADSCANTCSELHVEDGIKLQWEREQLELVKQVRIEDVDDWAKYRVTAENSERFPHVRPLQYIGGVDISFIKGDNVNACAAFVVLKYPELEVVYEDLSMVELTAPYIPGYLAFREAKFLVEKIKHLQNTKPELTPQVIMSDGNGILHPKKFGLSCHLGVLTDIPQLGVAKNLFAVRGIQKNAEFDTNIRRMTKAGDAFPLIDEHGEVLAGALKAHEKARNPIFVSPGHKLSVNTAVWIAHLCTTYRVPEPTRQADQKSREYLRIHFPTEKQMQPKKQPKKQKRNKPEQSETDTHTDKQTVQNEARTDDSLSSRKSTPRENIKPDLDNGNGENTQDTKEELKS